MNFRVSLLTSAEMSAGNLMGTALNLEINLGITAILTILNLPNYEHRIFLHLISSHDILWVLGTSLALFLSLFLCF
jgi:hypothetical protein